MRWRGGRRSRNVEDRRGSSPIGARFPGGIRLPRGRVGSRRAGAGGIGALVVMALLALVFGIDPRILLEGGPSYESEVPFPTEGPVTEEDRKLADFVSVVLADTEDTWHGIFDGQFGETYQEPTLVLFSGAVESACGFAEAAVGPFYCPLDQQVYIDLSFYRDLESRFQAPGDFAQAYVIAHEIGHHVQTLLGISEQVRQARGGLGEAEANALSVMQELQADCFAGVWAHHAQGRGLLERGDVEEALNAASAIGDDRLQMQTRGYVAPDSFTHGSSEQRVDWFRRGLDTGDLQGCDTFGSAQL
ncbi:MAG TPA: neutral zinc metallopeptidase [Alphaproteobacteria bacterium]|nr:neutral zinc metallopeptidase [Alphaproteobacteria bacterium]